MAAEGTGRRLVPVVLPRVDVRLLAGLALVLVSVVGGLTLWRQAQITTPVVVASRAIDPGDVIQPDDLAVAPARLSGSLASLAVPGAEIGSVAGRTATGPIHAGELVVRPDLGRGPVIGAGELAVTIPVDGDWVYGRLRRGDAVAVMATTNAGQPESRTEPLLERAMVYAVALEFSRVSLGGDPGGEEEQGVPASVTLVIPREQAARVSHALVNANLTLLLLSPAPAADRAAGSGIGSGAGSAR